LVPRMSRKTAAKLKSAKTLKEAKKVLSDDLKEKNRTGLVKFFKLLGMGAVAREIAAGRNVTGNAAFGIEFGAHSKAGPHYNPETHVFHPQTREW